MSPSPSPPGSSMTTSSTVIATIIERRTFFLSSSSRFGPSSSLPPGYQDGTFDGAFATRSQVALTTLFTPPGSCTARSAYPCEVKTPGPKIICRHDDFPHFYAQCFPPHYDLQRAAPEVHYSPGVCPVGYGYATTEVQTSAGPDATTFAVCCPSRAPHLGKSGRFCNLITDTTITRKGKTTKAPLSLWDLPIKVAWQESDLSLFTPRNAPLSGLAAYTSAVANGLLRSPSQPGGLSTGAQAGIGVGVAIFVVLLAAVLWLYWFTRRHRARKRREKSSLDGTEGEAVSSTRVAEASNSEIVEAPRDSEKRAEASPDGGVMEVPDSAWPHEADQWFERAELDGSGRAPEADGDGKTPMTTQRSGRRPRSF